MVASPYIVWSAIFIIVPLVIMFYFALTDNNGVFTFANITAIGKYKKAFGISILYAAVSTVITLLLAYPMAYFMTKLKISSQRMLFMIVMIPMWMNFLLRTLAWQTLLEKNGVINGILNWLHLPSQSMINTPSAIVLGMVYNFLPFMVLPIYNVLSKIDDNIINAAMDLGANSFQRFTRIWFPLSIPGIISGITMVFVPSLTTFVISDLLGGSKILLIGNVIEQEFTRGSNWHLGSGLSLVLMVFILISMAMIAKYDKNGEGTAF